MPRSLPRSLAFLLVALPLVACKPQPPSPTPTPTPAPTPYVLQVPVHTSVKLDILFMMDNSPSMDAMQNELRAHFGDLLTSLSGAASGHTLDLHVGVVTSDYGAGSVADPESGCDASPGGQRGLLQPIGAAADPGCQAPIGAPYIQYTAGSDGSISSNLPPGQDLVHTFECMSAVGSSGCGFEHQLESVYAALHDTGFNKGFVRPDAQLVVVFVTNEDDGSAPPATDIFDPAPSEIAQLGSYDTFRQTRFGIECGNPPYLPSMASNGPLDDCRPAAPPLGGEYDVQRYIDYFTRPLSQGGIKTDPANVILLGVMAPTSPFEIVNVELGTGNGEGAYPNPAAYQPCAPGATPGQGDCLVRLQHSCQNHVAPGFFGDPPLRLASVIDRATVHATASICGDDLDAQPSFGGLMSNMGGVMSANLDGGCLGAALADAAQPSCTVTAGGKALPACDGGSAACWTITDDARCPSVTDASGKPSSPRLVLHGVADGASVSASCTVAAR